MMIFPAIFVAENPSRE